MSKALVVLSGGQDSTTCLFHVLQKPEIKQVYAVTFNYDQTHDVEIDSAQDIMHYASLKYSDKITSVIRNHEIIKVPALKGTSPLVNKEEKLEQYKDYNSLPGGLEKTFVPMRNQLFLTVALNRAYCLGITDVYTGVCQEDFGGYPDCRQDFITALQRASYEGTFQTLGALEIFTPLMDITKAQSVEMALKLPYCYEALAFSHTAYDGQYPPLGKDHATLLREKGFAEAGIPDPIFIRALLDDEYPEKDFIERYKNIPKEKLASYIKRIEIAIKDIRAFDQDE